MKQIAGPTALRIPMVNPHSPQAVHWLPQAEMLDWVGPLELIRTEIGRRLVGEQGSMAMERMVLVTEDCHTEVVQVASAGTIPQELIVMQKVDLAILVVEPQNMVAAAVEVTQAAVEELLQAQIAASILMVEEGGLS